MIICGTGASLFLTLSITLVSIIFILSSSLRNTATLCPKSTLSAAVFPVPQITIRCLPLCSFVLPHQAINSCRRPYIFNLQGGSLNSLLAESTWSVSTPTIVGALEFEIDLLSPHCAITHLMSGTPLSSHKHHLPPLKYVFMSDWWLAKPCLPLQGLAVGGIAYGQRERMFLSTVIAKRHEANVLETEDGVTLHLSSFINSSRSFQNGFPREVCEDFLLGFPDDWQKYTAHSFRAKCVDGHTGFCEPNASLHKRAIDPIPFSIRDHRSAERYDFSSSNDGILKAKTNICNEPENSIVNVLKQSVSKNSVECSNSKKTVEGERNDNIVSLKSSQSLVDTMDDGENGVLVAAPISQVVNPNNDQSLTGVFDWNPCKVHSGKSMVGSPVSTAKIRVTQSSGDCKEEHVSHTRKYSKKNLTSLKETSSCPVRRSPRLSKSTK
ncbi:hypothetical protein HN51_035316 [Arachis hypogaea]